MKEDKIKERVKESYAKIAREKIECCPPDDKRGGKENLRETYSETYSETIGYTLNELQSVPGGSNLGLGCGNPVALVSLHEGESVVDLGSGAGLDCLLAAQKVGPTGKVLGVDMTPEMVDRANRSAKEGGYTNVEFKRGVIENVPVPDHSIDVVISNCVINLSPDKKQVFQEAFRILKPGGRMMISDIVLTRELPKGIKDSLEGYHACVSGAMVKAEYLCCIESVGFQEITVIDQTPFPFDLLVNDSTATAIMEEVGIDFPEAKEIAETIVSLTVKAEKMK